MASSAVAVQPLLARLALCMLLGLHAPMAKAHDLITAEAAERYLAQANAYLNIVLKARDAPARRAEASYGLGRMLDEIRDLLNRDLAEHGRLQGLPTEYLVKSLQGRGIALQVDPQLGRFPANLRYYRDALGMAPDGVHAADAMFRLLQGTFYDSFTDDPLKPRDLEWGQLQDQIQLGERLLQRFPQHSEREETQFILTVYYVLAARSGPDAATRAGYAMRARRAAAAFRERYPDSLRVAAVDVLIESLPAQGR